MRKFKVTDIHLDYHQRPNDDIYIDDYPKEMFVEIEDDSLFGSELESKIEDYIVENMKLN